MIIAFVAGGYVQMVYVLDRPIREGNDTRQQISTRDATWRCTTVLTRPPVMVVHGPDIFDLGHVRWLIENVRPQRTIVSGVMARTAAEESGLVLEFAGRPPSSVLHDLADPAFLANCGKTQESGQIFGRIIAGRLLPAGLVHLECVDRTIYAWNDADFGLADFLSRATGFPVERCTAIPDVDVEGLREIRGCIPGEPVFVNGLVIGTATAVTVLIRGREGRIEPVSGLHPKPHGFEKLARLGPVSPSRAWCKSGVVRRRNPRGLYEIKSGISKGRVIVIDHCGHDLYQNLDVDVAGVLAIGDDTTSICGHICAHRGIPVFGIVDGDADGVIAPRFAPGSVVIRVASGRDDEFGREVANNIPGGPVGWAAWVHAQVTFIGDRGTVMYPEEYPR